VAADGGYAFFRRSGLLPDLLIGDLDSVGRVRTNLSAKTKVISFPVRKDQTDGQLALDYCLDEGFQSIDLVSPTVGDIDHHLGNIALLHRAAERDRGTGRKDRLVNHKCEIRLLVDSSISFTRAQGDVVSVIPQSRSIVLGCSGMEYKAGGGRLSRGDSRGLRNRVSAARAAVSIRGEALIVRLFSN
jgi:thiamine pyrophosphokinase